MLLYSPSPSPLSLSEETTEVMADQVTFSVLTDFGTLRLSREAAEHVRNVVGSMCETICSTILYFIYYQPDHLEK